MRSRKYVDDYRLDNVLDSKGRCRTVSVYAGEWYRFPLTGAELVRLKTVCAAASLAAAVAAVFPLCRSVPVMGAWYVCIPIVFMLFAAGMAVAASIFILTSGDKVTREHRDKSTNRMKGAAACLLITSAISLTGELVFRVSYGPGFLDVPTVLSTALALIASVVLLFQRKNLTMETISS